MAGEVPIARARIALAGLLLAGPALAVTLGACAAEPTQIVLVVDSDLGSPEPLDRIEIEVASSATAPTRFDLSLDGPTTPPLPLTVALFPRGGLDVDVFVSVRALDARGGAIVSRTVRTRFVEGSSRMLRILLAERCVGVRCASSSETCDETGCRGIEIAGGDLPRWPGSPPVLDGPACEPEPEACNDVDDDCDGLADEGIDLGGDRENCGRCGHSCGSGACTDGFCTGERPVQIAAGGAHTCVRRERGSIACWGWNLARQCGSAQGDQLLVPSELADFGTSTGVAAGGAHTCFVLGGGVRCFGNGTEGELGNAATMDSVIPLDVTALRDATQISLGAAHGCAVTMAGGVVCWGRNDSGQLGDGTTTDSAMPVAAMGIAGARAVSAGLAHTCAALSSGEVRCWGANENGQLGDGTSMGSPTPVATIGLAGAVAVGVGRRHSCALAMDGSARCWGANESGQLGDGTTTPSATPVAVMGVTEAEELAVALAGTHACVVRASGAVTCWGSNLSGQLGDGTEATRAGPVAAQVVDAIGIAAGGHSDDGTGHACAIRATGAVVCWGEGTLGRLGDGEDARSPMPVAVRGLP